MGEPPLEPAVQMSDKEELEGVNETMLDAPGIEAFEETDEVDDVCVAPVRCRPRLQRPPTPCRWCHQ